MEVKEGFNKPISSKHRVYTKTLCLQCENLQFCTIKSLQICSHTNNDQAIFASCDSHINLVLVSYKAKVFSHPNVIRLNYVLVLDLG